MPNKNVPGYTQVPVVASDILAVKRDITNLRRIVVPQRDAVGRPHVAAEERLGRRAGRLAYLSGRMQKRRYADPSSPLAGLI